MSRATLVIMAAGLGSRFGGGIKQLAPVGPCGEIIMDYSIYDAVAAGFDKVVFVIRRDLEKDFREVIGNRIEKHVEVAYVFQEIDGIPEQYGSKFPGRAKPWGTGQAVLSCREVIDSPFLVINADDYYGKMAYREAYRYLTGSPKGKDEVCMVSFILKNTLSDNGGVTRGICRTDGAGMLTEIVETSGIEKTEEGPAVTEDGVRRIIDESSCVSMNMWGMSPEFFSVLDEEFDKFLSGIPKGDMKSEFLLPILIGQLLGEGKLKVRVLKSEDEWFGVTYKEDSEAVRESVNKLVELGEYPAGLYR